MPETAVRKYESPKVDTAHQRALRILKGTATFEDRFMNKHEDLIESIAVLRSMGCVIVFIAGVWDLIHIGHAKYIQRGKEEAAKLYPQAEHIVVVIGVDSDDLTKRRKGPERPIVPEDERLQMLGHLRPVDILTLQTESDQLFQIIEHDVRITSESTKDLPGEEKMRLRCEHLVNLPPQAETSTTARVRRLSMDGAAALILKVEKQLGRVVEELRNEIDNKS